MRSTSQLSAIATSVNPPLLPCRCLVTLCSSFRRWVGSYGPKGAVWSVGLESQANAKHNPTEFYPTPTVRRWRWKEECRPFDCEWPIRRPLCLGTLRRFLREFYRHDDIDFVPILPHPIALWCLKAIRRQLQYMRFIGKQRMPSLHGVHRAYRLGVLGDELQQSQL